MWRLFKSLLIGQIPPGHSPLKQVSIEENPTKLIYGNNQLAFFGQGEESFRVSLNERKVKIDLEFQPIKPMALIGGNGRPDDLYYYSFTKNIVKGQIQTDQGIEEVSGQGWFDHQWGRDYGLIKDFGWNWFGIQLDDGRELLINEMRTKHAKTYAPMANLIDVDGCVRFTRNVSFQGEKVWKSLITNARYPLEWKIRIPEFAMELQITAEFSKQEMPIFGPLQVIWEGACDVQGQEILLNGRRKNLTGKAFIELVGYGWK